MLLTRSGATYFCQGARKIVCVLLLQDKSGPDNPARIRRRVVQIPIENSGIDAIVRIAAEIGTDPHTKSLYGFK